MIPQVMELPRQIPYNPRWTIMLLCAAFFGACAAVMAWQAVHNTDGLVINGLFTLGPAGATIFYWVIAGLAGCFVLAGMLAIWRRIARPKLLHLETDALLLPHGLFQRQIERIAYADIRQVTEVQVSRQRFLYVTAGGLRYTVTASLFPNDATYTSVRDFLQSQVPR